MNGSLPGFGAPPSGQRLARIRTSPNYRDGEFRNPVPTTVTASGTAWKMFRRQLAGGERRTPSNPIPIISLTAASFAAPPASGLRITWLGHSTTLIEIDGARILVDPVFSERVSPTQLVGPRRFHPPPLPLQELPGLDAVVFSHDHYDHLDMDVVRHLASSPAHRAVPLITSLGVGAHLERWGASPGRVVELDWHDSTRIGDIEITATPARHFSGRGLTRNRTLWSSWVFAGPRHKVFHTGDTGWFDGLAAIGAQHGPFDVNLINIGAYADEWPEIHLTPEDAIPMHRALGGPLVLPIHWGTFNLAFHAWDEPVERLIAAAAPADVRLAIPRPGQLVEPANPPAVQSWWRGL